MLIYLGNYFQYIDKNENISLMPFIIANESILLGDIETYTEIRW